MFAIFLNEEFLNEEEEEEEEDDEEEEEEPLLAYKLVPLEPLTFTRQ